MKTTPLALVAWFTLFALPVFAEGTRIERYKAQLSKVLRPELARETARLVSDAGADTSDAVTAAIALNSPSAPFIVASVAKASPRSAAVAAAAAITSQPKQAGPIAKAAVNAAPSEIAAIVMSSCRASPMSFYIIGIGAAQGAPKLVDKIIPAIVAAVPALKPVIERAQNDFISAHRVASLALLLSHAQNILATLSRDQSLFPEVFLARETETTISVKLAAQAASPPPPFQGPPFISGSRPGEVPVGSTSTELPPGCRCYSGP